MSLEQMVSVGTDLASIVRSDRKRRMSVTECVDKLLSTGDMKEDDELHMFTLWFLRDKDNRSSYYAAKTMRRSSRRADIGDLMHTMWWCSKLLKAMSDDLGIFSGSKTDCDIDSMSENQWTFDEDVMHQLEEDINTWLEYCRVAKHAIREYLALNGAHWNGGHVMAIAARLHGIDTTLGATKR
ncbi:Protein STRUBBELIG-RECEPTOR FAMILY 3 [Olea europaea subsp. europaea]|uniref:Protein STRUBBELIG-RECEPTOR FAMILY 3 n=1 Tax=Olea europaea subsp. europaea TaxID=158383 RepID=A0A8S0RIZ4_OLEEU|nr:Protein STRUBBELIG-RECEPTOR FAMILY 3 [Olea europaea subsp. europaea]